MILSIIMPAYNAEKYLAYSIESIINQDVDLAGIELIIINDGSTDNTCHILDDYTQRYEFIKVFHQNNHGVSKARNNGLKAATGQYVTFIDSDDYIYKNTLNSIINHIIDNDLDICYLKYDLVDNHSHLIKSEPNIGQVGYILKGIQHPRRTLPPTVYKRVLITNNKIIFPETINFGEDSIFNFKVQYFADRVSAYNLSYYAYRQLENSLSKQKNTDKIFNNLVIGLNLINQFEKEVMPKLPEQIAYINGIYDIFITRIVELNILPNLDQHKYKQLVELLVLFGKLSLLKKQDDNYPYLSSNFSLFKFVQRYFRFKSKIYKSLFR